MNEYVIYFDSPNDSMKLVVNYTLFWYLYEVLRKELEKKIYYESIGN